MKINGIDIRDTCFWVTPVDEFPSVANKSWKVLKLRHSFTPKPIGTFPTITSSYTLVPKPISFALTHFNVWSSSVLHWYESNISHTVDFQGIWTFTTFNRWTNVINNLSGYSPVQPMSFCLCEQGWPGPVVIRNGTRRPHLQLYSKSWRVF